MQRVYFRVQTRHQPSGEWQTYATIDPPYTTTLSRRRWLLFFVKHVPVVVDAAEAERKSRMLAWCTAQRLYEAGNEVRIVWGSETWEYPVWKDGKWLHREWWG